MPAIFPLAIHFPQSTVQSAGACTAAICKAGRGVAGRSFPGRQEVVAFDNLWVAFEELPMALGSMINSPMVSST